METTLNIVSIIIIVFGILQIILFFKIWGMTNNISEIKIMVKDYIKKSNSKPICDKNKSRSDIKIDDLVVELKNERQLKVANITDDGKFECIIPGGISPIGIFNRDEIELFDRYWNKSK